MSTLESMQDLCNFQAFSQFNLEYVATVLVDALVSSKLDYCNSHLNLYRERYVMPADYAEHFVQGG